MVVNCALPLSVVWTQEKQLVSFWYTNILPGAGDRQKQCKQCCTVSSIIQMCSSWDPDAPEVHTLAALAF